ncbi:MAG: hypothetical protein IPK26_26560 [Planctomycetes bacterium]|nr:hypothetical protein [Planctomycetota bacterium]
MRTRSFATVIPCLIGIANAQIGFQTGFESPGFSGSPTGTPCAGQGAFFVPPVAGSIDAAIYTYAGNPLGVPANPAGGNTFFGAQSGGTNLFARAQRPIPLPAGATVVIDFDVCAAFTGSVTPTNNLGSFSFQPSTTNLSVNLLARWPTGVSFPPSTWNADFVLGPTAAGVQSTIPDPNFQNLPLNIWHRWGCTVDLASGQYVEFRLTNGATNVTTVFTPAPGSMPLPNQGQAMPTDFRLFAGGTAAGNVFAVDNLSVLAPGTLGGVHELGTGGIGSNGNPTRLQSGSPVLGTTVPVSVTSAPPNSLAFVLLSFGNQGLLQGTPLPPLVAGRIHVDLGLAATHGPVVTDPTGNAQLSFAVPNLPPLLGAPMPLQGAVLDTLSTTPVVASNALTWSFGDVALPPEPHRIETTPLAGPLLAQVQASPLVQGYAATMVGNGFGAPSFAEGVEIAVIGGNVGPAGAVFAGVPVRRAGDVVGLLFYTHGTDSRGTREGVDVIEWQPQSFGMRYRMYARPDMSAWMDLDVNQSGVPISMAFGGAFQTPYEVCFGACVTALIAAGKAFGLTAACSTACATCAVPPHVSCAFCITCAIGLGVGLVGCWWSC